MKTGNRLGKLRDKLTEKELDAIFISQPENRYYLSGFDGSAGYLLVTSQDAVLATDFRYAEQAGAQAPDYQIFQITGGMKDWFSKLMTDFSLKRLGFEAGDVTFAMYREISDILDEKGFRTRLVSSEGLVESLRMVKEPEEIELINRAVELSDRAFEHVIDKVKIGMTEKNIAWELEKYMREHGSQAVPFDIIVASGPNSALPHTKPTDRQIGPGEPIVIDMGAKVGGYCSDLTRTICLEAHDDTYDKVYDVVLRAQLATSAEIKEGMSGQEADNISREIIKQAGYGDAFGHSLGHGVGLAAHEQPRLGPNSEDALSSGMVFSIEPGIYLTGWGGVRIEDLAVMEDGKVRVLSRARKIDTTEG